MGFLELVAQLGTFLMRIYILQSGFMNRLVVAKV